MKQFVFDYMNQYFDEVEPLEFYRAVFPCGALADEWTPETPSKVGYYHALLIDKDETERKRIPVYNDLSEIQKAIDKGHDTVIAPVSYNGIRRTDANARQIFGIAIDLDGIETEEHLRTLFYQMDKEILPRCTYAAASGNGLHLYYLFDEPLRAFPNVLQELKRVKFTLIPLIWNRYTTANYKKPEYEAVTQAMRTVGGRTKDGGTVRAFETGERWNAQQLAIEYGGGAMEYRQSKMTRAEAAAAFPEWYERRVIKKQPRKTFVLNRGVYDAFLKRIEDGKTVGHRYYCLFCLAVTAKKCGIDRGELWRDMERLTPKFDELSPEGNAFTIQDARDAMSGYKNQYKTMTLSTIEKLSGIPLPRTRRNLRTQKEHLEIARAIRNINQKKNPSAKVGRKPKKDIVRKWQAEHPNGTKAACARETGITEKTVYKWWGVQETRDITFDSIRELAKQIEELGFITEEQKRAFYRQYSKQIEELADGGKPFTITIAAIFDN